MATLYRHTRNGWVKVTEKTLNRRGNVRFRVADQNGRKFTAYQVRLPEGPKTTADRSRTRVR